jgi:hypothetical protein
MDQVRSSELKAIGDWIRASVRDPGLLDTPLPELKDLKLDESLIRHARKDRVLNRFVDTVWSQFERCANCHSPDRNAKQVEKNGERMSWIVPNSPGDTLQLLEDRDLINFNKPSESTLRTKSLGRDDHGGGIKFPVDGKTDREWVGFLEDYAAIKKERYANASDIPKNASIRTWRTGHHLRIKDLRNLSSGQYCVVVLYAVNADGEVDKNAVAISEGRVSKDGTSWGSSLMLLEPSRMRHTGASVAWSELLPDGKVELQWLVVEDSTTSIEEILAMKSVARFDIDSLWEPGHSSAKSISFAAFQPIGK